MWLKAFFWRNFAAVLKRKGSYNGDVLHWSIMHRAAAFLGATNPAIGGGPSGESDGYQLESGGYQLESQPVLPTICLGGINAETQDCSIWDGFLWAVPKKRTSHSKKRMRMTHKYLKPVHHYTICPNCQNVKLLHVLCKHCLAGTLKKTAEFRRLKEQRREEKRLAKQQALQTPPPPRQITEAHTQ